MTIPLRGFQGRILHPRDSPRHSHTRRRSSLPNPYRKPLTRGHRQMGQSMLNGLYIPVGPPVSRELPIDPYRDHRWDFPCCAWSPFAYMPSPIPRQVGGNLFARTLPFACFQLIHLRLRSMKASPAARTRSATSRGGRSIYSSCGDLSFSSSESRGLAVALRCRSERWR